MKFLKFLLVILATINTIPERIRLTIFKNRISQDESDEIASRVARKWGKNSIKLCGGEIKVYGEENIPEGTCLFVGNHQGNFDIMLLMATINKKVGFVAKKEMINIPFFSGWMKRCHCVFLDRENPREAIKTFNEAAENLKKGYSMVIFPEGTRSRSSEIGEFKKGALKFASKASEIPIVPVACEGTYRLFESNNSNKEIKVSFCKPIYLDDLDKEKKANLTEYCKEIIESELKKIKS